MGKVVLIPHTVHCVCGSYMYAHEPKIVTDPILLQCQNMHCEQHGQLLEYIPIVLELNQAMERVYGAS